MFRVNVTFSQTEREFLIYCRKQQEYRKTYRLSCQGIHFRLPTVRREADLLQKVFLLIV